MLQISLRFGGLVHVSCLVLAAGTSAAGESVTYPRPGRVIPSGLRLDEASIEDLNAHQASGSVTSVDLVHARSSFSQSTCYWRLTVKGIHPAYKRSQPTYSCCK